MVQPSLVRPITEEERAALYRCLEAAANAETAQRARMILLGVAGKTLAEVSEELGSHPSNVKKWIGKFNDEGLAGIAAKKRGPRGGTRPTFTPDQITAIIELFRKSPAHLGYSFKSWSPQKLANAAVECGIVEAISHVTVRQILKRSGAESQAATNGYLAGLKRSEAATVGAPQHLHLEFGKAALQKSKYETAVEHFYAALQTPAETPDDEAHLRAYLSEALEELSRYEEAHSVIAKYEDPHTLLPLPLQTRAKVKLRIGWVNSWLRNYPKALGFLNEALRFFSELKDGIGVSETEYAIGHTYIRINEFVIARDHLLAAVQAQKTQQDRELLARIHDRLGAVDFYTGAFTLSKERYLKALELIEGSSNANLLGVILLNLGSACIDTGDLEESADCLRRAISYLETGGHKDHLALAYNNLGESLNRAGLWDDAIETLNKSLIIAVRYAEPTYQTTACITLGEILCCRGQFEEAQKYLKRSLDLLDRATEKWLQSAALRNLAKVLYATNKIEAAFETVRQAIDISVSIGDPQGVALAQVELSEFYLRQGNFDQAKEYIEMAQGRLKEESSLALSGFVQRLTGQLEASRGRFAEARQYIAQSISIFTTALLPFDVAISKYEMGRLLVKAGDISTARVVLQEACNIFEKLGANPFIASTRDVLNSLEKSEARKNQEVRVDAPSDMLLMQRLLEASTSRDLLAQELAAIVYDNWPTSAVMVYRADDNGRVSLLAHQGLTRTEAENLCRHIGASTFEERTRLADATIFDLSDGRSASVSLFLQSAKPLDLERLRPFIKQAELGFEACLLRLATNNAAAPKLEQRIQTVMPGFIVGSTPMFDVVEKIHKIRTSDVTVLITGESGTGKELIARAIHINSARAKSIFLPFNCTATPKDIIDSQLFGHRRGAFTGATSNYPGIIRAANGGTLFLDEIGDLSLEVQPKLMRFLQEGEIQPLGEPRPQRVDVRVLAATNTDLEKAVDDGRFREDLFHRLNIIRIHVPPLRERREEITLLATHFLEHLGSRSGKPQLTLSQDAIEALTQYHWPGNVRQLRNEIERTVAYASEEENILRAKDFSPEIVRPTKPAIASHPTAIAYASHMTGGDQRPESARNGSSGFFSQPHRGVVKLKDATAALERQLIEEALTRNRNNLSRTATELGLSRRGLRLKLTQLGIDRMLFQG